MDNRIALVYSGGLDSTVLLYHLIWRFKFDVLCINFSYGAKHNEEERNAARKICSKIQTPLIEIDLDFVKKYFNSALISPGAEIPHGYFKDETMRQTVVPFRNGIMLSIATGIANSNGIDKLAMASHGGDHFIYPDCRPEFIDAMQSALSAGIGSHVGLLCPFTLLTKDQIVLLGASLRVPFSDTWTCYEGNGIHCGLCGSCNERKEAFKEAGIPDPTNYRM